MAAGSTYTKIAATTLGSAATSYTFTSISSSYTDLVLIINGDTSADNAIGMQFNSDTGNNYSRIRVYGDGSSGLSTVSTGETEIRFSAGDSNAQKCTWVHHIMNYKNTNVYKTVLTKSAQNIAAYNMGLWRSQSAISSIKVVTVSGANFNTGTTFSLYGIAAA